MSKDQTTKVYAVWTNTDLTEGRGQEYVRWFCKLQSTALRLARGNYVQGTDCRVTEETILFRGGQWYAPSPMIVDPTPADLLEERELEAERSRILARNRALERARELGLSEDDIKALKG